MFDLIEVAIDLDDKLYERIMKKRYNQFYERAKIFFELTIKYYQKEFCSNQRYSNLNYCESTFMKLNFTQQRKEKNFRKKQDNKL